MGTTSSVVAMICVKRELLFDFEKRTTKHTEYNRLGEKTGKIFENYTAILVDKNGKEIDSITFDQDKSYYLDQDYYDNFQRLLNSKYNISHPGNADDGGLIYWNDLIGINMPKTHWNYDFGTFTLDELNEREKLFIDLMKSKGLDISEKDIIMHCSSYLS